MLTWWQGTGLGGLASGTDYIYNDHFQQIATVNAGNGYHAARAELPYSRSVTVVLDYRDRTATLVAYSNQPEDLSAGSQGDAQTTRNGDQFIAWGALPYFPEFSPSGQLLFNAEFPAGVNTYRAYRLPWFPRGPDPRRG